MLGLSTLQLVLIGAAIVVGLFWLISGFKSGSFKDSWNALWGKLKEGDYKAALIAAITNSDIVNKGKNIAEEVENVTFYARLRNICDDVGDRVAPDKATEAQDHIKAVILLVAANNPSIDNPTPAPVTIRRS